MSNALTTPKLVASRPFGGVDEVVSVEQKARMRGPILAGGATVLVFVVGFAVWASVFKISGGVAAPGVVVVEDSRKTVEQLDGGIISQVRVHEGDHVSKGQVLFLMDDTQARAQAQVFSSEYYNLLAQKTRLEAELTDQPKIIFPKELTAHAGEPEVAQAMHNQEVLFKADRDLYVSQAGVLNQRVQEMQSRGAGLKSQMTSIDQQNKLVQDELDGVNTLYAEGFAPKSRVLALQRSQAGLLGDRGAREADIASAGQSIGETRIQLAQIRAQRATVAADTLRQVQGQISDVEPRLRSAQAVVERTMVRSPVDGRVLGLTQFTDGGVAKPGERLLDVVPDNATLEVRVMVKPDHIDQVRVGMTAQVRLTTSQARVTPPLNATVATVAADRITDEKGASFFPVELTVSPKELKKLGEIKLTPGMQGQAMIIVGKRSILSYLMSPFTQTFDAALHES